MGVEDPFTGLDSQAVWLGSPRHEELLKSCSTRKAENRCPEYGVSLSQAGDGLSRVP